MTRSIFVLVFATVFSLHAEESLPLKISPADRWLSFRGSLEMTGQSEAKLPADLELLWSKKFDDSFEATAAVVDGEIYLPSMLGKCYALSLKDGAEKWLFATPDEDPAKSSPCVAGSVIVYGDDVGAIRGLDRATGKELWKFEAQSEVICSPTFIEGKVLIGAYDNFLYCLEPATGKVVWKVETQGPVHCSPSYLGGSVAVAGCDGFLRFVSVADGKQSEPIEIGGNIASTPAVNGSRLFFGTMNESVVGVDWKQKKVVWEYRNQGRSFPFYASPAVYEDLVIIGGRDKSVHALSQSDGSERWSYRAKARVESSAVVVGDRVYVGSHDGNVYGFEAKTGKKVWEYLAGGAVIGSPAVANGKLVISNSEGSVFCFGQKE